MIFYILPFFLRFYKNRLLYIIIILILLAGLRGYTVGQDTNMYIQFYRARDLSVLEPGFQFLIKFIRYIKLDYRGLFIFITSLNIYIYILSLKKNRIKKITLGIFLYITTYVYIEFNFNILRQGIAVTIAWYSISYLKNKKYLEYFCMILLSFLFHKTAFFSFIFLLPKIVKRLMFYNCLIGVSLLLLLTNFIENLVIFFIKNIDLLYSKYYIYLNSEFLSPKLKITTIILIIFKIIPYLILKFKIKRKNSNYEKMYLIYIAFEILSAKYLVLRRLNAYLIFYVILYTLDKLRLCKDKKIKKFIISYYYVYYILFLLNNFGKILPYNI